MGKKGSSHCRSRRRARLPSLHLLLLSLLPLVLFGENIKSEIGASMGQRRDAEFAKAKAIPEEERSLLQKQLEKEVARAKELKGAKNKKERQGVYAAIGRLRATLAGQEVRNPCEKEDPPPSSQSSQSWGKRVEPSEAVVTIKVDGLPFSVDTNTVREMFEEHGTVHSVQVALNRKGQSRGFAFVEMWDGDTAAVAVQKVSEVKLEDRQISARVVPSLQELRRTGKSTKKPAKPAEENGPSDEDATTEIATRNEGKKKRKRAVQDESEGSP